jgi:bacterioferritin
MSTNNNDSDILNCLNKIFQAEMSGVMRYLHYSFMIMGHNRIPIQKWFRDQANEGMSHAVTIGEKITSLGGHPPMEAVHIEETNSHNIDSILKESLTFEQHAIQLYHQLLGMVEKDVALEEMARQFIKTETEHVEEVQKMLRAPDKK